MDYDARKIKKYDEQEYYNHIESSDRITELRNGEIVYLASPSRIHQKISMQISWHINSYIIKNNGKCEVYSAPMDVKLNDENIVVPNIFVVCNPEKFDSQKYNGPPDWIIEIVSTNWADDYIKKLHLYQENGVREYWIVDPKKNIVTVYFFEEQFSERYNFSDDIPVNIYKNNLAVNISSLLNIN